ncbi:DUF2070 family protein [Candidatus Micrarchaeota archaeon]|nr:DUF2070 family protein [Candidatus Micrarchaeota archaeon]
MTAEEETIGLTRWFFGVPSSKITSLLILLWAIVVSFVISMFKGETLFSIFPEILVSSVFNIVLPAFLTTITLHLLIKRIGLKRILFISFIGSVIYGLNFIVYSITGRIDVVVLSFSVAFVFWYFTLYLIFGFRKAAILFAIVQLMFSLMFLVADQQTLTQNLWGLLIKIYMSAIILLIPMYYVVLVINAPMKKNIGISSTDAASFFFEQWMFGSKKLEEMTDRLSKPITTYLDWIDLDSFKLVLPYIHYGPFGNLGASKFTERIPEGIGSCIVFHSPVTREFNPSNDEALHKIVKIINDEKLTNKPLKGSLFKVMTDKAHGDVVVLNDFAIVGLSRAPKSTEDIDPGLGEAIKRTIESSGYKAFVVDMHNSETDDVESILPGSEGAIEYLKIAEEISVQLKKIKKEKIKIGYSEITIDELGGVSNKIGQAGIKIVSFVTKNKKYTIVVMDSNGIKPDARQKIIALGAETYTTDTHAVNTVRGIINPINIEDVFKIEDKLKTKIVESLNNAKELKGSFHRQQMVVSVLGRDTTTEIITTVNSIIAMAKLIVPIMIILSIIIILGVLNYLSGIGV